MLESKTHFEAKHCLPTLIIFQKHSGVRWVCYQTVECIQYLSGIRFTFPEFGSYDLFIPLI